MAKDEADEILAQARDALRGLDEIPDNRIAGPRAKLAGLLDLLAEVLVETRHRQTNSLALLTHALEHFRSTATSVDELADKFGATLELQRFDGLLGENRLPARGMFGTVLWLLLEPIAGYDPSRVEREGPPVVISSDIVRCLSYAVPELATNAIKFGALRPGGGTVLASWSVGAGPKSEELRFVWHERCDWELAAQNAAGKGSALLLRVIPKTFGVEVKRDFLPEGVRYELVFPRGAAARRRQAGPAGPGLLVVEDDPALRAFLAHEAEDMGFDTEEAGSVAEALAALDGAPFELAVVDRTLHDELSFAVAARLLETGTPFVFCTGTADSDDWGPYTGATKFMKGRDSKELILFLREFHESYRG